MYACQKERGERDNVYVEPDRVFCVYLGNLHVSLLDGLLQLQLLCLLFLIWRI